MLELVGGGGGEGDFINKFGIKGGTVPKKFPMKRGGGGHHILRQIPPPPLLPQLKMNGSLAEEISIGNSTICGDIWHKYHE